MNIESKSFEIIEQLKYDQAFRRKVRNKDPATLAELGIVYSGDSPELKVVSATEDTSYVPFPLLSDNYRVSGVELKQIQAAGKTVGTAGTAGTVTTIGSVTSCVGTFGCVGCAGSAGTAGG